MIKMAQTNEAVNIGKVNVDFSSEGALIFKKVVDGIASLVDEGVLEFGADGMHFLSMDASRVAMVSVGLPKELFESYQISGSAAGNVKIALDFERFSKTLKPLGLKKKDAKFSLYFDGNDALAQLIISRPNGVMVLQPIVDFEGEGNIHEPQVSFTASITLSADRFAGAIKTLSEIAYHVKISTDGTGELRLEAVGLYAKAIDILRKEQGDIFNAEVGKDTAAAYSLVYLEKFVKFTGISDKALLEFSADMPLKLTYCTSAGGSVKLWLAPRINDE